MRVRSHKAMEAAGHELMPLVVGNALKGHANQR